MNRDGCLAKRRRLFAHRSSPEGFALLASLLLLLLFSGLSIGVLYLVNTEMHLGKNDLENNLAYYAAEAAMEKMVVDVSALYALPRPPTLGEIQALSAAAYQPALPGISYPVYSFSVPTSGGVPVTQTRNIVSGPNAGLVAYIIPITLDVTARRYWGAEVRMTRNVEVALLPVFQFGVFSDTDLSYFAGAAFDFGGRVHTNGSIFLASGSPSGLVFHSRIVAVKEVIRTQLSNGLDTVSSGRNRPVLVPTVPTAATVPCRPVANSRSRKEAKWGGPPARTTPIGPPSPPPPITVRS